MVIGTRDTGKRENDREKASLITMLETCMWDAGGATSNMERVFVAM
jgi:hypothetical protein